MKRIILIALTLMLAGGAGGATAMDLLRCKDIGVTGFDVQGSEPRQTTFDPLEFEVVVISSARRTIKFPTYPTSVDYSCTLPRNNRAAFLCTSNLAPAVESIIFEGMKFERVINWSRYVGGQAIGMAVAYGTCRN